MTTVLRTQGRSSLTICAGKQYTTKFAELGLHPTAIAKLAGMIKSVASRGCQVILATQSTDLISHFKPEDIITVDQIHGESVFKRLDSDSLIQWVVLLNGAS